MANKTEFSSSTVTEEGGVRQRSRRPNSDRWQPQDGDWNPDLPYGGKVYLARKKKPDPWWVLALEVIAISGAVGLAYYSYFYFENLHYHVTHGYAHLGYSVAQHLVGEKLLNGQGVEKNQHKAMEWFKKAADQGHPHASYNLAIGHLRGIRKDLLEKGEPRKLIAHAAANGVEQARDALNELCSKGHCE